MTTNEVGGYSRLQIGLHWAVVLLIIYQYFAHEGMHHAYRAFHRGETTNSTDMIFANLHIVAGLLVLLFALTRLWLRFTRGVPALPENESAFLRFAARATHFLLYAVIIIMPISGLSAWFLDIRQAAEVHELLFNVLLGLATLHVAGALYQHFILKSDVLRRMLGMQSVMQRRV